LRPRVSIPQWFDCDQIDPRLRELPELPFQSHNGSIVTG